MVCARTTYCLGGPCCFVCCYDSAQQFAAVGGHGAVCCSAQLTQGRGRIGMISLHPVIKRLSGVSFVAGVSVSAAFTARWRSVTLCFLYHTCLCACFCFQVLECAQQVLFSTGVCTAGVDGIIYARAWCCICWLLHSAPAVGCCMVRLLLAVAAAHIHGAPNWASLYATACKRMHMDCAVCCRWQLLFPAECNCAGDSLMYRTLLAGVQHIACRRTRAPQPFGVAHV
jgi:hypothetical protein